MTARIDTTARPPQTHPFALFKLALDVGTAVRSARLLNGGLNRAHHRISHATVLLAGAAQALSDAAEHAPNGRWLGIKKSSQRIFNKFRLTRVKRSAACFMRFHFLIPRFGAPRPAPLLRSAKLLVQHVQRVARGFDLRHHTLALLIVKLLGRRGQLL